MVGRELIERFAERYVEVYGASHMVRAGQQGFVDESVAVPFLRLVVTLRQRHAHFCHGTENTGLRQCLAIHLSNPGCGAVGGDDYER